jgi:anti-sigma regulatory factor (Ser/Thr protein kinase)
MLRELLRDADAEVEILDIFELGRNPARIIPAVEGMLAKHQHKQLHYIGEPIWPGRSQDEIREATKHEALINLAWPGARIRLLCPYDAVELDPDVLANAERTHPRVISDGEMLHSAAYSCGAIPCDSDRRLPDPPPSAVAWAFRLEDLFNVRAVVAEHAEAAGLLTERVSDLVLAVNELATNAIRHGHGGGTLRIWRQRGRIVCQVEGGGNISDPLVGRRVPLTGVAGGVGLWTVNQVCDLVQVRTGSGGTIVRVQIRLE